MNFLFFPLHSPNLLVFFAMHYILYSKKLKLNKIVQVSWNQKNIWRKNLEILPNSDKGAFIRYWALLKILQIVSSIQKIILLFDRWRNYFCKKATPTTATIFLYVTTNQSVPDVSMSMLDLDFHSPLVLLMSPTGVIIYETRRSIKWLKVWY